MTIANAYGWELLCTAGFEAKWNGGRSVSDITIHPLGDPRRVTPLVSSHFGGGVLTFHTGYLFQTEPDWELVVSGPTNEPKDGIGCLTGVVETNWLPFPFTMNWRFTRPGIVRWQKDEPFCLIYPVLRNSVEQVEPIVRSLDSNPDLKEQYASWRDSRGDFLKRLRRRDSDVVKAGWQRHYFRGERVADGLLAEGHLKKLHPAKPLRIIEDDLGESDSDKPIASREIGDDRTPPKEATSVGDVVETSVTDEATAAAASDDRRDKFKWVRSSGMSERRIGEIESIPSTSLAELSYFICTTPRSGSNLLAQGLEGTAVAGRPQEFFDATFEEDWRKRLDIRREADYLPKIRDRGRTPNGVFGAKLLRFQWENLSRHVALAGHTIPDAPSTLGRIFGPPKFIWLRREDKTLQAISWFRAGQSKQWFHLVDIPPKPAGERPDFDAGTIAYLKQRLTQFDRAWLEYFRQHRIAYLEVVYEDFVHDYHGTIERVLHFLAPPEMQKARRPVPRYLRQADETTFDMLYRYVREVPDESLRTPLARRESNRRCREAAEQFQRREFGAAESALRHALEWDGLSSTVLQNLGSALASQGKLEEALVYFRRALRMNPGHAETCRNAALACEQSGELVEAESHYRKAAQLAPDTIDLERHLSRLAKARAAVADHTAVPTPAENRLTTEM